MKSLKIVTETVPVCNNPIRCKKAHFVPVRNLYASKGQNGSFFHSAVSQLFFFVFPAVAGGGDAEGLFEDLGEVIHVQNAHLLGYGGDAVVVLLQQLGRTVHPLGVDIVDEGGAGLLLEQRRQIRRLMKHMAARLFSVSGSETFRLT